MATTPGKPRGSGIPARGSGIPTVGGSRARSTSTSTQQASTTTPAEDEIMSKAFADAIRTNDPSQHRITTRISDASTVSSLAPSFASSSSSRRPSSVTSASSTGSFGAPKSTNNTRAKAAPGPRPASRTSDVFTRSASRAGRTFDVGDSVRIESLGFEGTLRYLGEIDGKQGVWAGVELSPGFAGKGKNDGSVSGKQYFKCPPLCGVFVASTKLSAATVGPSAISRPPSVASTRNGRVTPSISGRVTPSTSTSTYGRITPSVSLSNGRVTPATTSGRITPSMSTGAPSSSKANIGPGTKTPSRPSFGTSQAMEITPGSRASKYVGVTAKQLNSRDRFSPSRKSMSSPTRSNVVSPVRSLSMSSPSRAPGSPIHTPKPLGRIAAGTPSNGTVKGRPSFGTAKGRIPSSVAMPPPASPSLPTLYSSPSPNVLEGDLLSKSVSQIDVEGRALQDRINQLVSGRSTPASPSHKPFSRSISLTNIGSEQQAEIDRLKARLDALEYENRRLRDEQETADARVADEEVKALAAALQAERDAAQTRVTELEGSLRTLERSLEDRSSKVEGLERAVQSAMADVEKVKAEGEARAKSLQSNVEDSEALIRTLKETIEKKEGVAVENDAVLKTKDAEIAMLEARAQKAQSELEEERKELGSQVDELRQAGQETIALYEERLSMADSKRYEMEDQLAALQEELRARNRPMSPSSMARHAASAAEIDNENLREQVQHLQTRISALEDSLEDAQAAVEREEVAGEERIKQVQESEEQARKELMEALAQVEALTKAEAKAKERVAETQEAVRENGVALENARAEIEGLRAELADLESLASNGESSAAEMAQRSATERARHTEEIAKLRSIIEEASTVERGLTEQLQQARNDIAEAKQAHPSLNHDMTAVESEKAQLEEAVRETQEKLDAEHLTVLGLRDELDERMKELEGLKKRQKRDATVTNGVLDPPIPPPSAPSSPSKQDGATREELKGLKVIVQNLQQDNHTATQQIKTLEAENKLLLSETEQLRVELKTLEESFDQAIMREENALAAEEATPIGEGNAEALQKTLKESKSKHEMELEQLRRNLSESEMKNKRTIHDLNKEISELESLVESKIYREDELEREVERLNAKLARGQRKTSKGSAELLPVPEDRASSPSTSSAAGHESLLGDAEDVCEICEQPGHDIFSCDMLKGSSSPTMMMSRITGDRPSSKASAKDDPSDLFCVDCESHGHLAANCPHSLDVF